MKKTQRAFIKGINRALAGLMALLGFTSCDEPADEYGTPYANFIISGKVIDNGENPLSGMRAVVARVEHLQRATTAYIPDHKMVTAHINDTLYTQSDGTFEYHHESVPTNDSTYIYLKVEDPSENPSSHSDSTKLSFLGTDFNGVNGWYTGNAKKTVNIILSRKKTNE